MIASPWDRKLLLRLRLRSFNFKDCPHVNGSPLAFIIPDDQRFWLFDVRPVDRTETNMIPGLDFESLPGGKDERKGHELFGPHQVVQGFKERFLQKFQLW